MDRHSSSGRLGRRTLAGAAALFTMAIILYVAPAKSQQQTPPGAPGTPGARPRGGGFSHPEPVNFEDHEGWTSIWDGKTLNGWSGDSNWKVEDGAIVIESTCEKPTGTVYLVWQGGEAADFELKLEMKGEGNINGGIQYRGWIEPPRERPAGAGPRMGNQGPCPSGAARGTPPSSASEAQWNMAGAQYDFDAGNRYTGQFYEQATGRGIVAWRGDVVRTQEGKKTILLASLGDPNELGGYYKINNYNQLHIIARGNQMTHILNGHVMSVLFDEDKSKYHGSGKIGLEVESTGKLSVRNIWLKKE